MLRVIEMSLRRPGVLALVFTACGASLAAAQPQDGAPPEPRDTPLDDERPVDAPADPPVAEPDDPTDDPTAPSDAGDELRLEEVDEPVPPPDVVEPGHVEPPAPTILEPAAPDTGFAFGSYGRVLAGSDLRGGTPEKIAVVAHAPRIVEPSYVETDLYYRWRTASGARVRTVTTLAFGDTLFHYTGEFDAQPALRNLFLEATTTSGLTVWAGSRMYRGDDLYLFDWWPLDELNTVGGGASVRAGDLDVAVHAGVNRLLDPFQFQRADIADPEFGAQEVTILDRQRLVTSLATTYFLHLPGALESKVKLYGELQALPSGERRRADNSIEQLPKDWGLSLGAQLGLWGFGERSSHANLFARWSKGLTAFDELAAPDGLDSQYAAWPGATEVVLGAGGAYTAGFGNLVAATYARRFVDADDSVRDRDDGWEYAVDVRPEIKVIGDVLVGVDLSYQVRFPRGLSPTTLRAADPAVLQIAPMIVYAPLGHGAYDRPQLRLVWRVASLNEAARDLYAPDDPRRAHGTVHFLGVQAEWWFNSSTR